MTDNVHDILNVDVSELTIGEIVEIEERTGLPLDALGQADKIGSLEPGKLADIAIFDVPRYEDLAYRLGRNAVRTVIKRGQVVVEASRT